MAGQYSPLQARQTLVLAAYAHRLAERFRQQILHHRLQDVLHLLSLIEIFSVNACRRKRIFASLLSTAMSFSSDHLLFIGHVGYALSIEFKGLPVDSSDYKGGHYRLFEQLFSNGSSRQGIAFQ